MSAVEWHTIVNSATQRFTRQYCFKQKDGMALFKFRRTSQMHDL